MSKKKSKTQKYKHNQKRKQQKIIKQKEVTKEKQLVAKDQVKYNVVLNYEKDIIKKDIPKLKKEKKKINIYQKIQKEFNNLKKQLNKVKEYLNSKIDNFKKRIKIKKKREKEPKIVLPKLKKTEKNKKENLKQNKFIRFLICIKNNIHILFNSIIITTFIIMIIGLIRIKMYEASTIIYISCIVLFLMTVAISYNKYISGKIFTTIIVIGMILAIYKMQYTYDFIRNLNSSEYEYKTYYVVTFDNGLNRSIYNINNKKVGLFKENCTNIERKLNTKLNKVKYLEYEDLNKLFDDFYDQEFRALIVNENQYKFLENKIVNNRQVKILYEFEANAKK